MPQTSVQAGLWCDDTPITEGTWTGVSLGQLLENAGIDRGTATVKFSAEDDYSISMSVSDAQSSNAIVALSKDDSPLQETLRLVVPGGNGSLWVKGSSITIAASSTG
jgi:DMSO/TMAO reductase YedYZ molybdopterin-dependent catalytic subunit